MRYHQPGSAASRNTDDSQNAARLVSAAERVISRMNRIEMRRLAIMKMANRKLFSSARYSQVGLTAWPIAWTRQAR